MPVNNTQRSRPITKPDHCALRFRARLEQLENRTMLSGGCDVPQCFDSNLPPTLTNEALPYWIDQWYAWNQSTDWNVGEYLPAFNDFRSDALADHWFDGGDSSSWYDAGEVGRLQSWMDENEPGSGYSDQSRNELPFRTTPTRNAELDEPTGQSGDKPWQNNGTEGSWQDRDPFDLPPRFNDFAGELPNGLNLGDHTWIDVDINPVEPPSQPPWRPPREILHPPAAPIVIPPSYAPTQSNATVSQPTNLSLISAKAHQSATDEARSYSAGDFARSDDESTGDESPAGGDALAELAAGDASGALSKAESDTTGSPTAQSPKSSDDAPPIAATACDIAVAGAFAVVLSPPISRLLAAGAAPLANDAIGGTIQALWAWLRRRKAKRPNATDTPQDSSGSDESYASVDNAIAYSIDALTARSNFALAGGAGVAGVAAIASVWSRQDSAWSAAGGRSKRKLVVPTNDEPTRAR